jgi:glucose-1-phosphate cytidylyltransferase
MSASLILLFVLWWSIAFADTALRSSIGRPLMAVEKYVESEDVFLASYTGGLTDLDLASSTSCKPIVGAWSPELREFTQSGIRINAGFFVLNSDIFKYMQLVPGLDSATGQELWADPFWGPKYQVCVVED